MTIKLTELKDLAGMVIETLESGYDGYYCDLHNEVFNSDDTYIYTQEAIEALEDYGTFKAICEVMEYENDNFGDVMTDLSDPIKIANMMVYILGDKVLHDWNNDFSNKLDSVWDDMADDDTNDELVALLKGGN